MAVVNSFLYFLFSLGLQSRNFHTQKISSTDNELRGYETYHCPSNEVYVDCINPCKNCRQRNICEGIPYACTNGCDCVSGYLRNNEGACVLEQDCKDDPETLSSVAAEKHQRPMDKDIKPHCEKNEAFSLCGSGCRPTCENPLPNQDACDSKCVMACFCKPGFLRNKTGRCIHAELCQERQPIIESASPYESHGCPNWAICDVFCQTMYNKEGYCLGNDKTECICS